MLSLHQPRSDAFALFSHILLLSHGSVVYSGATRACLPHFARLGLRPQAQTNPLDFLIDISSVDTRDEDEERASRERVERLVKCWGEYGALMQEKEKEKQGPDGDGDGSPPLSAPPPQQQQATDPQHQLAPDALAHPVARAAASGRRPNVLQQTAILVPRATKNMLRGYPELVGHGLQAVILGLLMGITFFRLGGQPNDIQSLKTLAFQVVPVYAYMSQVVWTFKWCTALVVFDREREDSLYTPIAWVLAELLAWLPMNVIAPLIYGIMVYFICGMRTDDLHYNFGVFIADMIMVQMCFVVWSLFAASIEVSHCLSVLITRKRYQCSFSVTAKLCTGFPPRQRGLDILHPLSRILHRQRPWMDPVVPLDLSPLLLLPHRRRLPIPQPHLLLRRRHRARARPMLRRERPARSPHLARRAALAHVPRQPGVLRRRPGVRVAPLVGVETGRRAPRASCRVRLEGQGAL